MTTPPSLDPAPGLEVLGYRLVRRLGKGGFGEVWLATGPGGFEVAVKFVQRQTGAEKAEQRSLQILRVVKHHHLLTVFAAAEVGSYLVIVMELARASLLDRWHECRQQGQAGIPRGELLRYIAQAADGLDYLNAPQHTIDGKQNVGIQHRDIKPHNLLLVGNAVKVADFGLARLQQGSAASHSGSMTLAYAPPEFFQNRTSNRSDQFSLAATYVQMHTGKLPFGETMQEILARQLHSQEGPDLRGLPDGEREAVTRALAKNPEDRYPGCKPFVLALRNAMQGKETRTEPIGRPADTDTLPPKTGVGNTAPLSRPRRTVRRFLLWVAGIAACAMLLMCGLLVLLAWIGQSLKQAAGHSAAVSCVAWSPDGKRIVTGASDQLIKVWDAEGQGVLLTLTGHKGVVKGVTFSPDGTRILSGSEDRTARLWDASRGTQIGSLEGHASQVYSVAWSPDGQYLATAGEDRTARLWSAEGSIYLSLTGHTAAVYSVAFSPDSQRVVTGSGDGTAKVWGVATGNNLLTLQKVLDPRRVDVAWSPDGTQIAATTGGNTITLWDVQTAKERRTLTGHEEFSHVYSVSWSPNGKRLATGSGDRTTRIWDAERGTELLTLRQSGVVLAVAWSPDGNRLVTTDGNVARLWDAATGQQLGTLGTFFPSDYSGKK